MREREREIKRRRRRTEKRRKLRKRIEQATDPGTRQSLEAKIQKTYPSLRQN